MKVLNGFSRKGQRVEHDLLSGQPQVLYLWLFILWEEHRQKRFLFVQGWNRNRYSNPVESFRHVLVAKNTINRYHK